MQVLLLSLYKLPLDKLAILFFLVFARVGSCMMVMPAFSLPRVPMQIRLFLALTFSFAITPFVKDQFFPLFLHLDDSKLLLLICSEFMLGALMGASVQLFFISLQFVVSVISLCLGFQAQRSFGILDNSSGGAIENFFTLTALTLFFVTGMHLLVLQGLINSYFSIKPSIIFNSQTVLADYSNTIVTAFNALMRIASPFIFYAILVNFAVGLINKLTPMIPIYFISTAATMFGGLFLLYIMLPELLNYFSLETTNWITKQMQGTPYA